MSLQKFKDQMSTTIYGKTVEEVLRKGICINCREPALPKCYSDAGRKEYQISGMCEQCFDKLFS